MAVTLPKVYETTSTGATGSTTRRQTTTQTLDEYSRGGMFGWGENRRLNTNASAAAAANAYRNAAEDALG